MKDPAFLFYSKDFYEGTRTMLPQERACYIDLLIYQHQNGPIPNDIARLKMYCSGCDEETITRVLNHKFNQTVNGWSNHRLENEQKERAENKPKKIASATFAGLISSSRLTKPQVNRLKKLFEIDAFVYDNSGNINDLELIKKSINIWFNNMVNQMVNNIANADADADANNIGKGGTGGKPEFDHLPPDLNYPPEFDNSEFRKQLDRWLAYKVSRRERYKSSASIQQVIKNLFNLSGAKLSHVSQIIDQSIGNNWAGLFTLKNYQNETKLKATDPRRALAEGYDEDF